MATENDYEHWNEIRARVDSIANAIFLIGGGALSLSITVILSNLKKLDISPSDVQFIEWAWIFLSFAIVSVLFLKIFIVFQTFLLQVRTEFIDKHYMKFNLAGWVIGLSSFLSFCLGLYFMIMSASNLLVNNV